MQEVIRVKTRHRHKVRGKIWFRRERRRNTSTVDHFYYTDLLKTIYFSTAQPWLHCRDATWLPRSVFFVRPNTEQKKLHTCKPAFVVQLSHMMCVKGGRGGVGSHVLKQLWKLSSWATSCSLDHMRIHSHHSACKCPCNINDGISDIGESRQRSVSGFSLPDRPSLNQDDWKRHISNILCLLDKLDHFRQ